MIRHEVSPRQGHAGVPWNHAKLRRIHLQVQLECMQPKSSWSGVLLLWIPPGKDNFITQGLWAFWGPIRMSLLFIVQHRVFVFAACPDARLHTHRWKLWFDRLQRSRISSWKNPFWLKKNLQGFVLVMQFRVKKAMLTDIVWLAIMSMSSGPFQYDNATFKKHLISRLN